MDNKQGGAPTEILWRAALHEQEQKEQHYDLSHAQGHFSRAAWRRQGDRPADWQKEVVRYRSPDADSHFVGMCLSSLVCILDTNDRRQCLCGSDYTALPPYSESATVDSVAPSTRCRCGTTRLARATDEVVPILPVVELSPDPSARSRSTSHFRQSGLLSPPLANTSESSHSTTVRQQSSSRPPVSPQYSAMDRSSLYERLIAGRESESGEAPPAYEEITAH